MFFKKKFGWKNIKLQSWILTSSWWYDSNPLSDWRMSWTRADQKNIQRWQTWPRLSLSVICIFLASSHPPAGLTPDIQIKVTDSYFNLPMLSSTVGWLSDKLNVLKLLKMLILLSFFFLSNRLETLNSSNSQVEKVKEDFPDIVLPWGQRSSTFICWKTSSKIF